MADLLQGRPILLASEDDFEPFFVVLLIDDVDLLREEVLEGKVAFGDIFGGVVVNCGSADAFV